VLSIAAQFAPLLAAVISMPYLARFLGPARLGLLTLFWVILGYSSLLDLGMSVALTRAVSKADAAGEHQRIPGIFWTAIMSQLIMGAVGTIVLLAATPFVVNSLLNVPKALIADAELALFACAAGIPLLLVSSSAIGLLQAVQRFDLTTRVQIPVSVSQYILAALCSLWWPSLFLIVVTLLATRCIGTALLYRTACRVFPGLQEGFTFDFNEFPSMLRFGGWLTVSNLVGPLQVYADRFIIGSVFTVSAVAYYSVPLDASMRLLLIPASLMTAVFPALSAAGVNGCERVTQLSARSVRCICFTLGVPVTVAIVFSYDIMRAWMGAPFAAQSAPVLRIILLGIAANALARVSLAVLNASGRSDITAKIQLIELPFQMAATLLLLRLYGLRGAAWAWTARLVFETVVLFLFTKRVSGCRLLSVFDARLGIGIGALACLGFLEAALLTTSSVPLVRAVFGVSLLGGGLVAAWRWYLWSSDRREILQEVLRLWGGRPRFA